jgi:hypothetical protein
MNNTQDFKIGNKYSVDLTEYVDLSLLKDNYNELIRGIVRSKNAIVPVELGRQDALFDEKHIEPVLYIRRVFSKTDEYKALVDDGFTRRQIYDYVLFKYDVMTLGENLLLRSYDDYVAGFRNKHLSSLNSDLPSYEHFPVLKQWIKESGIFSEVGRVIFFVSNKGVYTPIHADYQNLKSRKDQFVWINLFSRKKFFVLDSNLEKQYVTGEINTFDNAAWHGSEPADYSCFSIRVDGLFTDKFLDDTGLKDHFYDINEKT